MVTEGGKRRKPRSTRVCRAACGRGQERSHPHGDREAVAERAHRRRRSRRNFTARQSTRYEKIITSSVRATSAYEGRFPGCGGARGVIETDGEFRAESFLAAGRSSRREGGAEPWRRGVAWRGAARRGRDAMPPTRSRRMCDRDGEIQLKILHITRYTAKMYLLFKSGRDRGGLLALARTRDSRT